MGPWFVLAILMAGPVPSPSPASRLRLEGLDRLYFARVARLPDTAALEGVSVRDVSLPVPGWPRTVVLRQVIAPGARIDELGLALYDGGRPGRPRDGRGVHHPRSKSKVSWRRLDAPPFAERGYKPPE